MLRVGDKPVDFILKNYIEPDQVRLNDYLGKVILLSFIDISKGWDWLEYLVDIYEEFEFSSLLDNVQIIAVIFDNKKTLTCEEVLTKVEANIHFDNKIKFPILVDNQWNTSTASMYYNSFIENKNSSSDLFSYIISSDFLITDMWNKNSTANGDYISFNSLKINSVETFDSTDFNCTSKFVVKRIFNLIYSPEILYSIPGDKNVINSLKEMEVYFSKPIAPHTININNIIIDGAGRGTLKLKSIDFTEKSRAENYCILKFTGIPVDYPEDQFYIEFNNEEILDTSENSLVGENKINLVADVTPPLVTTVPSGNSLVNSLSPIKFYFNEEVNIDNAAFKYLLNGEQVDNVEFSIEKEEDHYVLISDIEARRRLNNLDKFTLIIEGIFDIAGNKLENNVVDFEIDLNAPYIYYDSIEPDPEKLILNKLQEITIPFSEDAVGVDNIENYTITLDGAVFKNYTILNNENSVTIKFYEPVKGKSILNVYVYNIYNEAGNPLDGDNCISFSIDTVSLSINMKKVIPDPYKVVNKLDSIFIPFNRKVRGIDVKNNYKLFANGYPYLNFNVEGTENSSHIKLKDSIMGSVDFKIKINNITDEDGFVLTGENSFSIFLDTIPPKIVVDKMFPTPGTYVSNLEEIVIPFSEEVLGANEKSNYSIKVDNKKYDNFNVLYNDRKAQISLNETVTGSVEFIFSISKITDRAGNSMVGERTFQFQIHTIAPEIIKEDIIPDIFSPTKSVNEIHVPFTEEIVGASEKENYRITLDGKIYSDYDISYKNKSTTIKIPEEITGYRKLIIQFLGLVDIAGNPLMGGNEITYIIDTIEPEISFDEIIPKIDLPVVNLSHVFIPFNKDVIGANEPSNYSVRLGKKKYTHFDVYYTNGVATIELLKPVDGEYEISFEISNVRDLAGNKLDKNNIFSIHLDSKAPGIDLEKIVPGPYRPVKELHEIIIPFNKEVNGAGKSSHFSLKLNNELYTDFSVSYENLKTKIILEEDVNPKNETALLEVKVHSIYDDAGNSLIGNTKFSYTIDPIPPKIEKIYPQVDKFGKFIGKNISDLSEIKVTFSKPVIGADELKNYSLKGEGTGSLKIVTAEKNPDEQNSYILKTKGAVVAGEVQLYFENINDSAGNCPLDKSIKFHCQSPHHIVLVLDYSSFMNMETDSYEMGTSRLDHLKYAISEFFIKWNHKVALGDKIGIVIYGNKAIRVMEPGDFVGKYSQLNKMLKSDISEERCAVGSALANALDMLEYKKSDMDFGAARSIILLSAGQQNQVPYIKMEDNGSILINTTKNKLKNGCPDMSNIEIFKSQEGKDINNYIPIYTISVGMNHSWTNKLYNISMITGGKSFFVLDNNFSGIASVFDELLSVISNDFNYQIVKKYSNSIYKADKSVGFHVNKSANKLLLSLRWKGNVPLAMKLYKDNKGMDIHRNLFEGRNFCVYLFDLETLHEKNIITEGFWEMLVQKKFLDHSQDKSIYFDISVCVIDDALRIKEINDQIIFCGEDLEFGISVYDKEEPIKSLYSIDTEIHGPNDSIGNLISKNRSYISTMISSSDGSNPRHRVDQVIDLISENRSKSHDLYPIVHKKMSLEFDKNFGKDVDHKKPLYNGKLKEIKKSGIYRINYLLNGIGEKSGFFERCGSMTSISNMSVDSDSSIIKFNFDDKSNQFFVKFIPRDVHGNFLGPGFSEYIAFKIGDKILAVSDEYNGAYSCRTKIPAISYLKKNPVVIQLGKEVFNGMGKKLVEISKDKIENNVSKFQERSRKAGNVKKTKSKKKNNGKNNFIDQATDKFWNKDRKKKTKPKDKKN